MSVSVDFVHVDGQTLVLVVNDYSRIPFVEPVSSTSASAVIPKLDQLFSTFGAPPVVKSENGPPFNEEEFAKFACVLGFKHQKVTPLWSRASGKVERFVKTLKKCIKAAKVEVRNWRKEKQAILRNYRTTPHATTGVAPAVPLLKWPALNKLPQVNHIDPVAELVREHNSSQKLKMKAHANNKAYVCYGTSLLRQVLFFHFVTWEAFAVAMHRVCLQPESAGLQRTQYSHPKALAILDLTHIVTSSLS